MIALASQGTFTLGLVEPQADGAGYRTATGRQGRDENHEAHAKGDFVVATRLGAQRLFPDYSDYSDYSESTLSTLHSGSLHCPYQRLP